MAEEADIDMEAALEQMSEGLFDDDEKAEKPEKTEIEINDGGEGPAPAGPVEEEAAEEENAPAVQEIGAPKTWTKDALAEWATTPPRVQQEILKREEDFHRGIEQYKSAAEIAQRYESVIEPYRPILAATGTDPVQLFSAFAGNHYMLVNGSPEEKLRIAQNLISSYGIDPVELAQRMANGAPQTNPELDALRSELRQTQQLVGQAHQTQQRAVYEQSLSQVQAFAADPKNIHFDEVAEDIQRLLETGAATSLEQAYETAVWSNPTVRARELERQTAQKSPSPTEEKGNRKKRALAANVESSPQPKSATAPVGTMDETLEETMQDILARDE